jgi:hypothetical protein
LQILLSLPEQKIARYFARERQRINRAAGIIDQQVSLQKAEDTELVGFAGELAFCKLFNLYPDFSLEPRRGGHDCVWHGERVDVKATDCLTGQLLGRPKKKHEPVDIYALMICYWCWNDEGSEALFTFPGYATRKELFADDRLTDLGRGPVYAIPQCDLRPYQGRFDF